MIEAWRAGLTVLVGLCVCACGFNVDTRHAIVREADLISNDKNAAFGSSVAIHEMSDGHRLLVGAPKSASKNNNDVTRPGAVYSCSITGNARCQYVELEEQLTLGPVLAAVFDMDNELFGQTIASSDGNLVVCAPLFKLNNSLEVNQLFIPSFYPVGRCMLFNSDLQLDGIFSPTTTLSGPDPAGQPYIQGQFGFSVDIKDGNDMAVGCPRCSGIGNAFTDEFENVVDDATRANENPIMFDYERDFSSFRFVSGDYLGFSVAIGKFFGSVMIAVGRPKAGDVFGEVSVFRTERVVDRDQLSFVARVQGEEVGAMFGYSVAAADLNMDGFSDLVVGAPFHGSLGSSNKGQIFAYLSDQRNEFGTQVVVTGSVSGGMFGLAVASLGDIDLDGFEDVVVAAPFIGSSQSGEVYIYRGSKNGLKEVASQIIKETSLRSFGYALTKAVDIDGNHYPDLLVGAFQSQKVVLFRARPVVVVTTTVETEPDAVDVSSQGCTYEGIDTAACFNMTYCFKFDVREKADPILSLVVNYTVLLDSKETTEKRLVTKDSNEMKTQLSSSVTLIRGNLTCYTRLVAVQKNIRNTLRPFFSEVRVEGVSFVSSMSDGTLPELDPIQDADRESVVSAAVAIKRRCRGDPCVPNLKVQVLAGKTSSLIAGSEEEVLIPVRVSNDFDDSYGTKLSVVVDHSKLRFSRDVIHSCPDTAENCNPNLRCVPSSSGALCDVGNPLPRKESVELTIIMRQLNVEGNERKLDVRVNASSEDDEKIGDSFDNEETYSISVGARVTIQIDGAPIPSASSEWNIDKDQVVDLVSGRDELRDFVHLFRLRNNGPSPLPGMEVQFWWPVFGVEGTQLLEMPPRPVILVENEATEECDMSYAEVNRQLWPESNFAECAKKRCMPIRCVFNRRREQRRSLIVMINSTLSLKNLVEYTIERQGDVSNPIETIASFANATVMSGYSINSEPSIGRVETSILFNIDVQECVPVWIVIVSVIGALLLLAVAVVVLYMLGFFKQRRKHSIAVNRQRSDERNIEKDDSMPTETHAEDEKRYSHSSSRLSKSDNAFSGSKRSSDGGSDGYEPVKRKSRTPSLRDEDVFKMGPVELQEEPRSARNWRQSDDASDMADMQGEPSRLSHSSYSQTTV